MAKPVVVLTGVSGNLGMRLLPLLGRYTVVGVDVSPPKTDCELQFESLDLGEESSARTLYELLRDTHAYSVIHLAFVIDPVRTGVLDVDRMWRINVAGTARVMEAITEVNRAADDGVKQFVFPSSVSAYGTDLPAPATEDTPLAAHTLPYAIHKKESDEVVRQRCSALRGCSVYILRPHIFAGASVENYLMGAFRGTPNGKSERAQRMRPAGKRLPCMLPSGQKYLDNRLQFIHVDDMARAREFYEGVLGLDVMAADARFCAYDAGGQSVLLLFLRGGSVDSVVLPGGVIPPHDGSGRLHVGFAIDR